MEVVPSEETETSQPFSVPFHIHNSGYSSFYVKRAMCFEMSVGGGVLDGNHITNNMLIFPINSHVDRGHNETITCGIVKAPQITKADMVVVVEYSPWGLSRVYASRQYFHFKGAYVDKWQWIEISPEPVAKNVEDAIRRFDQQAERFRRMERK